MASCQSVCQKGYLVEGKISEVFGRNVIVEWDNLNQGKIKNE